MEPIGIIVALKSVQEADRLCEYLSRQPDMTVLAVTHSGEEVLTLVRRRRPALLILDAMLGGVDGFEVMRRLTAAGSPPQIILTSLITRDDYINAALSLGASFFLPRPVDLALLDSRIRRLFASSVASPTPVLPKPEPVSADDAASHYIGRMLMHLAVPPHLAGHRFLRQAIFLSVSDPSLPDHMGTLLYPAVADAFQTTPSRVERAIRFAIARSWDSGGSTAYCKLLNHPQVRVDKPSNREFISSLAERVRLSHSRRADGE